MPFPLSIHKKESARTVSASSSSRAFFAPVKTALFHPGIRPSRTGTRRHLILFLKYDVSPFVISTRHGIRSSVKNRSISRREMPSSGRINMPRVLFMPPPPSEPPPSKKRMRRVSSWSSSVCASAIKAVFFSRANSSNAL